MKSPAEQAVVALRIVVAGLVFVHGTFRLFAGGVAPFGEFLTGAHLPFGTAIAWGITIIEIVGTIILASGIVVRPLALYFAAELLAGIILVHRHDGWFVVGGGRNGMEYSALLISSLLIVAWGTGGRPKA